MNDTVRYYITNTSESCVFTTIKCSIIQFVHYPTFTEPDGRRGKLLGFNLFRVGEYLNPECLLDLFLVDIVAELLANHLSCDVRELG
jgi:hypothetical protein